jgi:hypothetical protein
LRDAALVALLLVAVPAGAAEKPSSGAAPARPFWVSIHVASTNPADTDQRVSDFLDTW